MRDLHRKPLPLGSRRLVVHDDQIDRDQAAFRLFHRLAKRVLLVLVVAVVEDDQRLATAHLIRVGRVT